MASTPHSGYVAQTARCLIADFLPVGAPQACLEDVPENHPRGRRARNGGRLLFGRREFAQADLHVVTLGPAVKTLRREKTHGKQTEERKETHQDGYAEQG
jgi:hypothetical protein